MGSTFFSTPSSSPWPLYSYSPSLLHKTKGQANIPNQPTSEPTTDKENSPLTSPLSSASVQSIYPQRTNGEARSSTHPQQNQNQNQNKMLIKYSSAIHFCCRLIECLLFANVATTHDHQHHHHHGLYSSVHVPFKWSAELSPRVTSQAL